MTTFNNSNQSLFTAAARQAGNLQSNQREQHEQFSSKLTESWEAQHGSFPLQLTSASDFMGWLHNSLAGVEEDFSQNARMHVRILASVMGRHDLRALVGFY